jgi:hypothetical protein
MERDREAAHGRRISHVTKSARKAASVSRASAAVAPAPASSPSTK